MMFRVGAEYVPFESVSTFERRARTVHGESGPATADEVLLRLKTPRVFHDGRPPEWDVLAQGDDARAIIAALKDLHDLTLRVA